MGIVATQNRSFRLPTLGRLKKEHLLLHHGIVLKHAERTVRARADHGAVVARHGHGDEPDGDGSRLGCWGSVSVGFYHGTWRWRRGAGLLARGRLREARRNWGCVDAPFFAILLDVPETESVVRWMKFGRGLGENRLGHVVWLVISESGRASGVLVPTVNCRLDLNCPMMGVFSLANIGHATAML